MADVPQAWAASIQRLGGYSLREKACIEFRIPQAERQLDPAQAQSHLRFWLKARHALPPGAAMHASAFAYLSDWWINFASLAAHMRELDAAQRSVYVASLNHSIWFHSLPAADQWLHVDSHSPCARDGRGLSIAQVHDAQGRLVATVTQECLMAHAASAGA